LQKIDVYFRAAVLLKIFDDVYFRAAGVG